MRINQPDGPESTIKADGECLFKFINGRLPTINNTSIHSQATF